MKLVAALTAATLLSTAGVASAAPAVQREAVQESIDQLTSIGGALGVQVRVTDGLSWTARSGSAELGKTRPVPHNGSFRIGSVTKPFVSAVVLQLVGEGAVSLDAPVAQYLPDVLPGKDTTVRRPSSSRTDR